MRPPRMESSSEDDDSENETDLRLDQELSRFGSVPHIIASSNSIDSSFSDHADVDNFKFNF